MSAKPTVLCALAAVVALATGLHADMQRTYLLGDKDNFTYEGVGSEDDVYVRPDVLDYLREAAPNEPNDDFDVLNENNNVPFTFLFPLGAGESVTDAYLTVALRATDSLVTTDAICMHGDESPSPLKSKFDDLGWLPIPENGTSVRTLDLSDVLGTDYRPILQDGELTVTLTDDVGIDYAELEVSVVPVPPAACLGAVGLGMLGLGHWRRKRTS